METKSKLPIENFKRLDPPLRRGNLEPHIYQGLVKNVLTLGQYCDHLVTWDKHGRCSNLNRSDCFIDVEIAEKELNLKPQTPC